MTDQKLDPMNQARKRLLLDHVWWGALSLRLKIEATELVERASVDGVTLRYRPSWFETLPADEQEAVCAHEVEHVALLHMSRLGSRDPKLANIAMDHVVNLDLKEAGFRVPEPHYADPQYAGMSFEKVYALLKQQQDNEQA